MASDADQGKPNVDDISLEDPKPAKKSGGGGVVGIVVFLVIVAAVAAVLWSAQVKRQAEEAKRKADAALARQAQIGQAKGNVKEAVLAADQGDLMGAIAKLTAAKNMYDIIVSSANADGDQTTAAAALADKGAVADALKAMEEAQLAVKGQADALRAKFGLPAAAAPATEETPAPDASAAPTDATAPPAADATVPAPGPVDAAAPPPAPAEGAAPTPPPAETATPAPAAPTASPGPVPAPAAS